MTERQARKRARDLWTSDKGVGDVWKDKGKLCVGINDLWGDRQVYGEGQSWEEAFTDARNNGY